MYAGFNKDEMLSAPPSRPASTDFNIECVTSSTVTVSGEVQLDP